MNFKKSATILLLFALVCVCVVFESCSKRKYAKKMVVKITATDANTARTWDATKMSSKEINSVVKNVGLLYLPLIKNTENRELTEAVLSLLKSDSLNNAEDAILKRVKVEYTNYKDKKFSRVFDEIASQKFLSEGVDFDDVKAGTDISVTATATQGQNKNILDSNMVDRFEDSVVNDDVTKRGYNNQIVHYYDWVLYGFLKHNYASNHFIAQKSGLLKSAGEPAENRLVTLTVTIDGGEDRIADGRAVSKKPGDSVTVTVKSKGK